MCYLFFPLREKHCAEMFKVWCINNGRCEELNATFFEYKD